MLQAAAMCLNNHKLVSFTAPEDFCCDICNEIVPVGHDLSGMPCRHCDTTITTPNNLITFIVLGCRQCDWDVCVACHLKRSGAVIARGPSHSVPLRRFDFSQRKNTFNLSDPDCGNEIYNESTVFAFAGSPPRRASIELDLKISYCKPTEERAEREADEFSVGQDTLAAEVASRREEDEGEIIQCFQNIGYAEHRQELEFDSQFGQMQRDNAGLKTDQPAFSASKDQELNRISELHSQLAFLQSELLAAKSERDNANAVVKAMIESSRNNIAEQSGSSARARRPSIELDLTAFGKTVYCSKNLSQREQGRSDSSRQIICSYS